MSSWCPKLASGPDLQIRCFQCPTLWTKKYPRHSPTSTIFNSKPGYLNPKNNIELSASETLPTSSLSLPHLQMLQAVAIIWVRTCRAPTGPKPLDPFQQRRASSASQFQSTAQSHRRSTKLQSSCPGRYHIFFSHTADG